MTIKEHFLHIMDNHIEMAIATSTYSQPNVRIVNFYFDKVEYKLYFLSVDTTNKIREFDINPKIAFTTVPNSGYEHVRARGIVRKSRKTFFDIEEAFKAKVPVIMDVVERAGEDLSLFEIEFQTAIVSVCLGKTGVLEIAELKK